MKWLHKKTIAMALLAALPIEAVVFFLLPFPIDVGYEPGTAWYIQLIGLPWIVLHFAGLYALSWIERVAGCHQPNIAGNCGGVDTIELFISGYGTSAVLLIAILFVFQQFRRRKAS